MAGMQLAKRCFSAAVIAVLLLELLTFAAARPAPNAAASAAAATHVGSTARALKQSPDAVRNRVIFDIGAQEVEDYLFNVFLADVEIAESQPFFAAAGAGVSAIVTMLALSAP